jgi:hypothetical protein
MNFTLFRFYKGFKLESSVNDAAGSSQLSSARFALAPRLTLEVSGFGRAHWAKVHIKLTDPATKSELTASEWAARFGPRVLPAPGAVALPEDPTRTGQLPSGLGRTSAYYEHGLSIEVISSGRIHILDAELRRWEEGSTEWSAPPAPWGPASFRRLY